MRKYAALLISLGLLGACSKHDPILPGQRTSVFNTDTLKVLDADFENLSDSARDIKSADCPYSQDSANIIWNGDKKIFSGFRTPNSVQSNQKPVCDGNYIYAGLTTGELIKINKNTRHIYWTADIYRASNLTGGAEVLDIVAPVVLSGKYVYAGGMGDAVCKIGATSGKKQWCANVATSAEFVLTDTAVFVLGTDKYLYGISDKNGDIYWRTKIDSANAIKYKDKIISIGKVKINAINGDVIKD